MRRLQCPSCGAPFPKRASSTGPLVCEYCAAEYVTDATGKARTVHTVDLSAHAPQIGAAVSKAGRWVIGAVAVCFGLALLVTGLIVFVSFRTARQATHAIRSTPPLAIERKAAEVWTVASLSRLTPDRIDVPMTVSPPTTALAAFDPASSLPWALAIAQGWQRDVRLERIDAERVRPDGTVDLAGDPESEVRYRFWSPSRIEEFHRQADLNRDAKVACEFWLQVEKGAVTARVLDGKPDDDPLPPFPEIPALSTTFATLSAKSDFPRKPFFDGYLIHLPDEGWVWYLQTLSGESLSRVRARDGRQYPY